MWINFCLSRQLFFLKCQQTSMFRRPISSHLPGGGNGDHKLNSAQKKKEQNLKFSLHQYESGRKISHHIVKRRIGDKMSMNSSQGEHTFVSFFFSCNVSRKIKGVVSIHTEAWMIYLLNYTWCQEQPKQRRVSQNRHVLHCSSKMNISQTNVASKKNTSLSCD